jgi:hypothetical protein
LTFEKERLPENQRPLEYNSGYINRIESFRRVQVADPRTSNSSEGDCQKYVNAVQVNPRIVIVRIAASYSEGQDHQNA